MFLISKLYFRIFNYVVENYSKQTMNNNTKEVITDRKNILKSYLIHKIKIPFNFNCNNNNL